MRRVDELAAIGADVREAQRRHVQILAAAHEGIGRRRAVGPPCKLRLCGSLLCNAVYMDSSLVSARIRRRDQDRMQSYIRPLLKPRRLRAMMGIRAPRANQ